MRKGGRERTAQRFAPRARTEIAPGAMVTTLAPVAREPGSVAVRCGRKLVAKVREQDALALGVSVGTALTERLISALRAAEAKAGARRYAINAAAYRGMSRKGLITRLRKRGLDEPSAASIADEMVGFGLVNEPAFARSVVEGELSRKPAGKTLLLAKLRAKGVDDRVARGAVDAAVAAPGYDAREQALALARRRMRTLGARVEPEAIRRRLYGLLARRGFDPETCGWAVKKAVQAGAGRADAGE